MQKIFRTMSCDGAHPRVGTEPNCLGARVGVDVHPVEGLVGPGGGLSVAPDWRELPGHLIPRRLKPLYPGAKGKREGDCIWYAGETPFTAGDFASGLCLRVTSPHHGQLEPAKHMSVNDYQNALADTRNAWRPIPEDVVCPARVAQEQ